MIAAFLSLERESKRRQYVERVLRIVRKPEKTPAKVDRLEIDEIKSRSMARNIFDRLLNHSRDGMAVLGVKGQILEAWEPLDKANPSTSASLKSWTIEVDLTSADIRTKGLMVRSLLECIEHYPELKFCNDFGGGTEQ